MIVDAQFGIDAELRWIRDGRFLESEIEGM